MALTSRDETDLILPLFRGMHEESRFSTFLERLRRRTGADYAALAIRREDSPLSDASVFYAGINLHEEARRFGIEELYTLEGIHHSRLRPFRVYSVSDFVDHDPDYKAKRASNVERLGIVDERVVRVSEEPGISAWLILARGKPCSAADSALLSNLAPYVATALRSLNLLERRQIEASLSTEGLGRSGAGWVLFDKDARILAIEAGTVQRLAELTGSAPQIGERLRNIGAAVERELAAAASQMAGDPDAAPSAVVLSEEPRVDALLVSASAESATLVPVPAMVAYCRFAREGSPERVSRLARLFELPPREAELAIALCDGQSIAEAASKMGLTLETARNYSKRLYSKLGVRGQTELVRRVYESSAVLT